jgi:hypothetical protein
MFRQQSAIIRELLESVWVTWNAEQIGGISYNVSLCGLCAGVLWFRSLRFPADRDTYLSTYTRHTYIIIMYYRLYQKRPGFSLMVYSRFIRHVTVCISNLTGWLLCLKPSFVFQFQQKYSTTKSFVIKPCSKMDVKPVMEK